MEPLEVKIFGYSLYMNVQSDKVDYYRTLAEKVNKLMFEEAARSDSKSDIKTAIKVAFIMANESNIYRSQLDALSAIVDQLEITIDSIKIDE